MLALPCGRRGAGAVTGGPKPFSARDRSAFLGALDRALVRLRRNAQGGEGLAGGPEHAGPGLHAAARQRHVGGDHDGVRPGLQSLREAGAVTGGPKPFSARDRSAFLGALDRALGLFLDRHAGSPVRQAREPRPTTGNPQGVGKFARVRFLGALDRALVRLRRNAQGG
jgi:uncharacterized protein YaiI (UPF0178 family)